MPAIENVLVGPLIAVLSFVCSVGNVPLAAVLWSGGISFAGVLAFLFADLIVLPIIAIYRKYYGTALRARIVALMFVTMVLAALVVDGVFSAVGPDPDRPATDASRHLRHRRGQLQARPERARRRRLRGVLLADAAPRCDRPGVRDEGRPHQGAAQRLHAAARTTSARHTARMPSSASPSATPTPPMFPVLRALW